MPENQSQPIDMEKAMLHPGAVFESPEALRDHPALSKDQKIELLRRWEYDEAEMEVATDEGMPGGNGSLVQRIVRALDKLTGGVDVKRTGPTKQAGLLRQPKKE